MLTTLVAFVGLSIVVICTPGPDTALTVRNAIVGGRTGGVWTAAGVATGQMVWTVAASVGVAGLLYASEPAFIALKLLGAGYLLYLGAQSLRAALARRPAGVEPAPARVGLARGRAFRQGLINDLGNPKMAAFFLSALPQFVPTDQARVSAFVGLGLLFCLMTFAWLSGYSLAIGAARRLLERSRVRRTVDGIAGVTMVGFGIRLALANRT
jgi:threonine/homoserine/homoserine lactone efflux protein